MNQKQRVIAELALGHKAKYKGHGNSMYPRIPSGSLVTLEPVTVQDVSVGDVVFCKVRGTVFLHLVSAIRGTDSKRQVQISNYSGHVNGWTSTVYGRAILVEKSK